ncbi:hypothetical protein AB0L75_40780 [Streptomyces sp. NPDC052101]
MVEGVAGFGDVGFVTLVQLDGPGTDVGIGRLPDQFHSGSGA